MEKSLMKKMKMEKVKFLHVNILIVLLDMFVLYNKIHALHSLVLETLRVSKIEQHVIRNKILLSY